MGIKDTRINECLLDAVRYADCFNTAIGSPLLSPDQLVQTERITEGTIAFPKTITHYKKERDGVMGILHSQNILCAIVCIENQMDIHYAQVVRHFIYDAYSYNKQLTDIRKRHRNHPNKNGHDYQGFSKEDRLIPTATVCVYYGEEPWDAATNLLDLIDFKGYTETEITLWKRIIQDYQIIVLDIRRMSDKQIEDMRSDLKLLFGMLKYADNTEKLRQFTDQNSQDIDNMQEDPSETLAELCDSTTLREYIANEKKKGGTIKMKNVWDEMYQKGISEGEARGESRGEARGEARGEKNGRFNTIKELVRDNVITLTEAAKRLNMSEEALLKQIQ